MSFLSNADHNGPAYTPDALFHLQQERLSNTLSPPNEGASTLGTNIVNPKTGKPNPDRTKIFDVALETRKFEIGLFWQRALFFWGFIASAFVAYAAIWRLETVPIEIRTLVAAFGLVCSVAWTFANRGSKYWQGAWEAKLETFEEEVLGIKLFQEPVSPRKNEIHFWGVWSDAWHFSVSKLAIALSDFTVLVWAVLLAYSVPGFSALPAALPAYLIAGFALAYVGAMVALTRSRNRKQS